LGVVVQAIDGRLHDPTPEPVETLELEERRRVDVRILDVVVEAADD
jgi:hypothetical protein